MIIRPDASKTHRACYAGYTGSIILIALTSKDITSLLPYAQGDKADRVISLRPGSRSDQTQQHPSVFLLESL
jgi:hypothetical protein